VIGIQTLRRVDFHDERNVIILAVSLGFAMTPTVYPTIVSHFPQSVQTIISSGITLGSISAIVLNLVFNVWGGHSNLVTRVLPIPRHEDVFSIDQVNQLDRGQFVATFGPLFQGAAWIAEQAYDARPFENVYGLRKAFQDVLFEAPAERQLELIRQYPDLAGPATREGRLPTQSVVDQAIAGLDRLNSDEYSSFDALNRAYREKFGFPLVVAVRENTKETILRAGNARLENSSAAERAAALVEIAKIANLRLLDIVEEPVDRPVA
jgi:OHCU decarboxylase